MPVRKRRQKDLRFQISHFHGSFSNDIMAVKGLTLAVRFAFYLTLFSALEQTRCPLFNSSSQWLDSHVWCVTRQRLAPVGCL